MREPPKSHRTAAEQRTAPDSPFSMSGEIDSSREKSSQVLAGHCPVTATGRTSPSRRDGVSGDPSGQPVQRSNGGPSFLVRTPVPSSAPRSTRRAPTPRCERAARFESSARRTSSGSTSPTSGRQGAPASRASTSSPSALLATGGGSRRRRTCASIEDSRSIRVCVCRGRVVAARRERSKGEV